MSQPPTLNYDSTGTTRHELRAIASRQRKIMLCILAYLVLLVCQFALPPLARPILGLAALAVCLAAVVFVFQLATRVYSMGVGIVLGILTLIPIVGLVILLIVNGKATGILRQHNIKVGLLGADVSKI